MSQEILQEMNFFLHSLLIGVVITFFYDWLLILRKCIRHNIFFISIEDILFWIACALGVFYMLYQENNGILRWFAVLGAAVGMWLYKRLVSYVLVEVVSSCIIKTCRFLIKPLLFICRKILRLIRKVLLYIYRNYLIIAKKVKKLAKFVKKKLTIQAKLIKMILCKQASAAQKAAAVKKTRRERRHGQESRIS
jgi:spore cortex biosynthesis protein YabQ